jgi:hypothetical protein
MWWLSLLCVLALTSPAAAQDDKGKGRGRARQPQSQKVKKDRGNQRDAASHMRFKGIDTNGDGVITRQEWRGNSRSFANHDWNGDGVLSGDEVRPGATRPSTGTSGMRHPPESDEVLFARLDRNRNGILSRDEWQGTPEHFSSLDFDKDGVLNTFEFGIGR